jgi:hypothetical protein
MKKEEQTKFGAPWKFDSRSGTGRSGVFGSDSKPSATSVNDHGREHSFDIRTPSESQHHSEDGND